MTLFSKLKWVASVLLVFFVVLGTNLIDKRNFKKLSNSVITIYEDRMVASDILFELSLLIQKKEVAVVSSDLLYFQTENQKANEDIENLEKRYERTKLTQNEFEIYQRLKEELGHLKSLEIRYNPADVKGKEGLLQSIKTIDKYLGSLSKIQLREARTQMFISSKAMDTINLFTQFEILSLIILALLVQIIILYKTKKS